MTTPARPRSVLGRVLRWIALVVAVLFTLLALWLAAENVTGRIRLARWDQEMRAKGEKLTLADLRLPPAGPKAQRFCPMIEATQALKDLDSCKLASEGLPLQKQVVPGKVVVLPRQEAPIDTVIVRGTDAALKEPHGWADLAAQLDRGRMILENLRAEAREGKWDPNVDWSRGFDAPLTYLGPTRNAARWLSAAAIRDLHEGRRDAAIANAVAIVDLGRAMRDEPTLIGQLVRIAVDSIGLGTTWQALQAGGWSDAQLETLQKTWERAGALDGLPRAFEGERALGRLGLDRMRGSRNPFAELARMGAGEAVPTGPLASLRDLRWWFEGQMWKWGLAWNDELAHGQWLQTYIDAGRNAARERDWGHLNGPLTDMEKRFSQRSWLQNVRQPLVGLLAPAFSRASLSFFHHEVQREMTVAALAIERFKLKHKTYPNDLAELVPEFLAAPRRDFMDGNPLRYRKNADGTFALWSVGENLVDDGGDPSPSQDGRKQVSNMWDARDFVWPQSATAAEIKSASSKP